MSHVTAEDVKRATEDAREAKAAYDEAVEAEEAARDKMRAECGRGPISRDRSHPSYSAWKKAVSGRDEAARDLERARRTSDAMRNQRLKHLARLVSLAVLEKCEAYDGKPCRYKRVKKAVESACADIDGARVELYDSGELVVYDSTETYGKGISIYPSGYDCASGCELFHPAYLEKYLYTSDGIDGMLSHILSASEVRDMVSDLDEKLRSACEKIKAGHDAARKLEESCRVIGLGGVVSDAAKRAIY